MSLSRKGDGRFSGKSDRRLFGSERGFEDYFENNL